jgi:hypothetical protein
VYGPLEEKKNTKQLMRALKKHAAFDHIVTKGDDISSSQAAGEYLASVTLMVYKFMCSMNMEFDADDEIKALAGIIQDGPSEGARSRIAYALGYRALVVEVDESEFPYLVYGVLEGRADYRAIRDALPSLPDYAYAGSVTAVRDQRDGTTTAFALNLTPPNRGGEANPSRIMARMKGLMAPTSR